MRSGIGVGLVSVGMALCGLPAAPAAGQVRPGVEAYWIRNFNSGRASSGNVPGFSEFSGSESEASLLSEGSAGEEVRVESLLDEQSFPQVMAEILVTTPARIPEPGSLALVALGIAGLAVLRRRNR